MALGLLTHHYGNKEKLFLTAGLDVLERMLTRLRDAVAGADDGLEAVQRFCGAYLEFSLDPGEHFLVLVRCSPYSDMATREDREVMMEKFEVVPAFLEQCVRRGVEDGSILPLPPRETAGAVQCNLVGAVRTRLLTPTARLSALRRRAGFHHSRSDASAALGRGLRRIRGDADPLESGAGRICNPLLICLIFENIRSGECFAVDATARPGG